MEQIDQEVTPQAEVETPEVETPVQPAPKQAEKPVETLAAKKARLERQLDRTNKQLGITPQQDEEYDEPETVKPNTGELSETQLDYLDLKGINDDADIAVIKNVMKRTGQTVRQVLADDYVQSKLKANKTERDVKSATPSSSKRSGQGASDDVNYWVERNERTGEWPSDFALKAKIVEAKERKYGNNAPSWLK